MLHTAHSRASTGGKHGFRTRRARPWLSAIAAAGLILLAGASRAQAPAGFTCGEGLQGQLFELGSDVPNTAPDRIAALTGAVTDSAKDAAFNDWGSNAPTPPFGAASAADHFFDRWYGGFLAPSEGDYTFTASGDDGVRLWLSKNAIDPTKPGAPVINAWIDQGTTSYTAGAVHLKAGEFLYVLFEHYENGGGAVAKISLDGGANAIDKKNLCAGPLPAAVEIGAISGTVKDTKGNPFVGSVALSTPGLDSSAVLDASGVYSASVPAGNYSVTAVPADQATAVTAGGTAFATVTKGGTSKADLTVTVAALPSFTLDAVNSTWRYLKEPTTEGKVPSAYNPAILSDLAFKDSAWFDQDPMARSTAEPGVIIPGNYWLRGKFKLGAAGIPGDFPVDRAAVMYNFDVDARSLGIWVNGVPVGASPGGDTPAANIYLIPSGVLNKTGDNLIAIRGENGGGDMGLSPNPIHIRSVNTTTGTVQVRSSGVDPNIGGVGDGTLVSLVDAGGKTVGSATTMIPGVAFLLEVPTGVYSLTASGALVDSGAGITGIEVKGGQTAVVTLATNPAKGLGNGYLNQGGPWRAVGAADAKDLKPAKPDFDNSKWQTVTFLPGNLRNGDQALTEFGENEDDWLRVTFAIPAEWAKSGRDLVFDHFNVDDSDVTYFNGTQIGATTGAGTLRSYTIPNKLVKFGGDNVIAILNHNDAGDSGITDRTNVPRIHVASGAAVVAPPSVKGDINGDGKVDLKDATLSLSFAVNTKTPTDPQKAAGDVNGDGKLDLKDATLILGAAVGIRTL